MMSLGLAACSNEADSPFAEGMGGLCLIAKMDTEITIPVITKRADFSDLQVEDLFIRIYDAEGTLKVNETYTIHINNIFHFRRICCHKY